MLCLGLESSWQGFSIALGHQSKVFSYRTYRNTRMIDQVMVVKIKALLSQHNKSIEDVDVFLVDQGPGSFTGLRVGISTIKGMTFNKACRIVPMPSLDIIAHRYAPYTQGMICVIQDARRDLVYAGLYDIVDGKAYQHQDFMLVHIEELLDQIKNRTIFIGDGIALYEKQIKKRLKSEAVMTDEKYWHSHAKDLIMAGQDRIKQKKWVSSDALTPIYLYPEHCQVKKKQ